VKSRRFLGGPIALLSLIGTVRADIPPPPPPPPTIPGTEITLPGTASIVLIGVVLSMAIVLIGLAILRKRGPAGRPLRAWVVVPATVVSIATAGVAIWAAMEHSAHAAHAARERANWRPNGPPPSPESEPQQPPTNNPPAEESRPPDPKRSGSDK
jgi:hypothetical protein